MEANISILLELAGHAVAHLVEALCYRSEGGGLDARWFN